MKTAKIGAIFLVSVMALAGVTAGYAWWTDELHIKGTITTDDFGAEWELDCVEFSDFVKWADGVDPDYDADGNPIGVEGEDYWILAIGEVELADCIGYEACGNCRCKTLYINATDVFPSNDIMIQGKLNYYGSCPAHLYDIDAWGKLTYEDGTYVDPVDWSDLKWLYVVVKILPGTTDDLIDQVPDLVEGEVYSLADFEDLICTQWHEDWHLDFIIYIHFIQWDMIFDDYWGTRIDCSQLYGAEDFDVPQNAELEFAIDLYFKQWNYNGL